MPSQDTSPKPAETEGAAVRWVALLAVVLVSVVALLFVYGMPAFHRRSVGVVYGKF